jgi:hypothetical protein
VFDRVPGSNDEMTIETHANNRQKKKRKTKKEKKATKNTRNTSKTASENLASFYQEEESPS